MEPLAPVSLAEIRAAARRLAGAVLRTPLVHLDGSDDPAVHLKLESLQPIGSFKLRGAGNAIAVADPAQIERGVWTASAGNMAQGVAWNARRLGIRCRVVVPETAPRAKLDALARLGGEAISVPFADWWRVLVEHRFPGLDGLFIHPVSNPAVIAGNGTIGLEMVEDLPGLASVVVPFGGGGLSCGIACAVRALRPGVPIFAAEVETAAPLAASLAAGRPVEVPHQPSFVDGIGSGGMLSEMWPLASSVLDGSIVVSLRETADAMRLLATRGRVISEGAGAVAVAAALTGRAGRGPVAAVVSGGNIDRSALIAILSGEAP